MEPTSSADANATGSSGFDPTAHTADMEYTRYAHKLGELGFSDDQIKLYRSLGLTAEMVVRLLELGRFISKTDATWMHTQYVRAEKNLDEATDASFTMINYWGMLLAYETVAEPFQSGVIYPSLVVLAKGLSTLLRIMEIADNFGTWSPGTPSKLEAEHAALMTLEGLHMLQTQDRLREIMPHAFADNLSTSDKGEPESGSAAAPLS